jgi:hypothetical protein
MPRYKLRMLLIVAGSLLLAASGIAAVPTAWAFKAAHPNASLFMFGLYSVWATIAGIAGVALAIIYARS